MHITDDFRELRAAWFRTQLQRHAHEREWETEVQETERIAYNRALREQYDQQTEDIIAGRRRTVAPQSASDLASTGGD